MGPLLQAYGILCMHMILDTMALYETYPYSFLSRFYFVVVVQDLVGLQRTDTLEVQSLITQPTKHYRMYKTLGMFANKHSLAVSR